MTQKLQFFIINRTPMRPKPRESGFSTEVWIKTFWQKVNEIISKNKINNIH